MQNDTTTVGTQNTRTLGEIQSMRGLVPQQTATHGENLDAIQNLMSRLSIEAPSESIPLQEHLKIIWELTREQAPPNDIDSWVDWVAVPSFLDGWVLPSLIVAIDYDVSSTSLCLKPPRG